MRSARWWSSMRAIGLRTFQLIFKTLTRDFLLFSTPKMCGPDCIGALYGKLDILNEKPPFLGGGDMIRKVTFEGFSTSDVPSKFEAGTPAIAEAVEIGAAVDYLNAIGYGGNCPA
jgi:cysteine desulfurase/selenocysteine lyase